MNAYFESTAAPLGYFGNQGGQVSSSPTSQGDQYRGFNLLVPPYAAVGGSAVNGVASNPHSNQPSQPGTPQNNGVSTRPDSSERQSPPYETDKSSSYDYKASTVSATAQSPALNVNSINSTLSGGLDTQKNSFIKDIRPDIAALAGCYQTGGGGRLGSFDSNWAGATSGQAGSPGATSVAAATASAAAAAGPTPNFYPWMAIAG